MNPLTLFINAMRALIAIPPLMLRFSWHVLRGKADAMEILENELPRLIFLISPVVYVTLMVVALVILMTSGGIQSPLLELLISLFLNAWIFITISLGIQAHDTRLVQAQSIQYYLLFVGFLQTFAWVANADNPRSEPSSVFILFLATTVTFTNEKVIKPNIEKYPRVREFYNLGDDDSLDTQIATKVIDQ